MIRRVSSDGKLDRGGIFTPIERPRVSERFSSAAAYPIILVVAPAGYGKSVALTHYLNASETETVRFNVRPEHSTVLGFLRGFSDAIFSIAPDARRSLAEAYRHNRGAKSGPRNLALWLHAHLKSYEGIIAIDDFHNTEQTRQIADLIIDLIDRSKARIRWIVASRDVTHLPVGSWLAYGDSDLAVDDQDLRFTLTEMREVAHRAKVSARDEELAQILEMTNGWPTAIAFALRSSIRSTDLKRVYANTRELTYQYLAEQVYRTLEPPEKALLSLATFLDDIDPNVLSAAGCEDAASIIESLRRRVSFLYEDRPGIYKCHDLFRDFLSHQLKLQGKRQYYTTAKKTARALERLGKYSLALQIYGLASAGEDVLHVLRRQGLALLEDGHGDVLNNALAILTPSVRASDPTVLGIRGSLEADAGRLERAEALFRQAIERCELPLKAELSASLALLMLNSMRDIVPLLAPLQESELPVNLRGEICSLLGIAYAYGGRRVDAERCIDSAADILSYVDGERQRAKILHRIGIAGARLGMEEAELINAQRQAASIAVREGMWSLAGRAYVALASISQIYKDDAVQQIWFAQQAATAAAKAGDRLNLQTSLLQLLNIEARRGNSDRIRALEQQIAPIASSFGEHMIYIVPVRAFSAAWGGQFGEAHRLIATLHGNKRFLLSDRLMHYALDALFLMVTGKRDDALAAANQVVCTMIQQESMSMYERRQYRMALLIQACVSLFAERRTAGRRILDRFKDDESDTAVAALRDVVQAIDRAIRAPITTEEVFERLQSLRDIGYGGYSNLIHSAFENCGVAVKQSSALQLTRSEREILRFLADGRTPKEVAADSGRSVHTIHVHIQNIVTKFGCSGRAQAIAIAKKRGVIA